MSYVGGHQDVDGAPLLTPGAERSEGHVDPTGGRRRSGSAALGGPRLVLEVLLALVPVLDLATDVIVVVTVVEVGRLYAGRERLDALRHAVEGQHAQLGRRGRRRARSAARPWPCTLPRHLRPGGGDGSTT